jgi:hypothetical protein
MSTVYGPFPVLGGWTVPCCDALSGALEAGLNRRPAV